MRPRYRFVFTGFKRRFSDDRAALVSKIQSLGGIYYESESFKPNVTHVVCSRLCRSEKFLSACASGKRVVTPLYIDKCFEAKRWLNEDDFEWKPEDLPENADKALVEISKAPTRNRKFVAAHKGEGLFYGKKIVLFIQEGEERNAYRRVLTNGGANVITRNPPNLDSNLLEKEIDFFMVQENKPYLLPILRANVLCISTDYIRNFLLQENTPTPSQFDIRSYVPNSDIFYSIGKRNSPLKVSSDPSPPKTPSGKSATLVPLLIRASPKEIEEKTTKTDATMKRSQTSIKQFFSSSGVRDPKLTPEQNKSEEKKELMASSGKRKSEEDQPSVKRKVLAPIGPKSLQAIGNKHKPQMDEETKSAKLKIAQIEMECADYMKEEMINCWQKKIKPLDRKTPAVPYPETFLIESYFIDMDVKDYWHTSLSNFDSLINRYYYLSPKTVQRIITEFLLNGPNKISCFETFTFLTKLLTLLPPDNFTMRKWYCSILQTDSYFGMWAYVRNIIKVCCEPPTSENPLHIESRSTFLYYLQMLLETDFAYFITRSKNVKTELTSPKDQPLIVQMMWGSKHDLSLNLPCSELMKYFVLAIHNEASYNVITAFRKLVELILQCAQLGESENGHLNDIRSNSLSLVKKLLYHLKEEKLIIKKVAMLVEMLQLSWSRCLLAQLILDETSRPPNSIIKEFVPSLSLRKIVNYYMKLVPGQRNQKSKSSGNTNDTNEHSSPKSVTSEKINKRNCKGESVLHRACIGNRIENVKELLRHPEIDVNVVDNAGWTPLHEACNHGHDICVKLLLEYRRPRSAKFRGLAYCDLTAKNSDGITPLHDAVVNNHLKVVKLLLQHGGRELTEQRDKQNRQPLDLARSEEMRQILTTWPDKICNENIEENKSDMSKINHKDLDLHVRLVFILLNDYLEYRNLALLNEKIKERHLLELEANVMDGRENVLIDDVKTFHQLEQHVTDFLDYIKNISDDNMPLLQLTCFKMLLIIIKESTAKTLCSTR